MDNPPSNSPAQRHPTLIRLLLVRGVWFVALFFTVGAILTYAAVCSFPRSGASDPLTGWPRFQEALGIMILRVAQAPFDWLGSSLSAGMLEVLACAFWAFVLYGFSAWARRPRWVFKPLLPPV